MRGERTRGFLRRIDERSWQHQRAASQTAVYNPRTPVCHDACRGGGRRVCALVRAGEDDLPTASILFVVAAPLALMLILSLVRAIEHLISVWRKRRDRNSDA